MDVDVPSPDGSREMESDRESSSADEEQVERALATLNASFSFDAYQNAISVMRKAGNDIIAIRKIRYDFADKFPLPAPLWMEWAEDELMIAASAADRLFVAESVIARGLRDYVSTGLARKLMNVQVERWKAKECGAEVVHAAFRRVREIGAAFHFNDGAELWGVYYRFLVENGINDDEKKRFVVEMKTHLLQPAEDEEMDAADDVSNMLKAVKLDRLSEMQDLVVSCQVFESKLEDARNESPKEPGIQSEELKARYVTYATFLADGQIPSAKSVWERCIEECFLDNSLWGQYATFCREHRSLVEEKEVLDRAVRNVPWDLSAWVRRVRNISARVVKNSVTVDEAASELVSVLHAVHPHVFASASWDDAMRLSIAALTCYKRLGLKSDVRKTAFATITYSEAGSVQWAHCKFAMACVCVAEEDKDGALGHLEEVVDGRGMEGLWWQRYAMFLLRARAPDVDVREVFQRGVQAVEGREDVEMLGALWMDFEAGAANGLGHQAFDSAEEEIEKRVAALPRAGPAAASKPQRRVSAKATKGKKTKENGGPSDVTSKKRKKPESAKRQRRSTPAGNSVQMEVEGGINPEPKEDSANLKPKEPDTKPEPNPAPEVEYEANTVFINNLPYKATEDDLREKFANAGAIKAIRIPKRGDGAAKGIAYVEFEGAEGMEAALKLHNTPVRGRAVWVRKSKPPRKGVAGKRGGGRKGRGTVGRGRGRINLNVEGADAGDADKKKGEDGDAEMVDADKPPEGALAKEKFKTQDEFRALMLGKKH